MFADQTQACLLIQSEHPLHGLGTAEGLHEDMHNGESPGEAALTGSKGRDFKTGLKQNKKRKEKKERWVTSELEFQIFGIYWAQSSTEAIGGVSTTVKS